MLQRNKAPFTLERYLAQGLSIANSWQMAKFQTRIDMHTCQTYSILIRLRQWLKIMETLLIEFMMMLWFAIRGFRGCCNSLDSAPFSCCKASERFLAEESLGLQKQPDGHQWTEPGDQQSHFHPQG